MRLKVLQLSTESRGLLEGFSICSKRRPKLATMVVYSTRRKTKASRMCTQCAVNQPLEFTLRKANLGLPVLDAGSQSMVPTDNFEAAIHCGAERCPRQQRPSYSHFLFLLSNLFLFSPNPNNHLVSDSAGLNHLHRTHLTVLVSRLTPPLHVGIWHTHFFRQVRPRASRTVPWRPRTSRWLRREVSSSYSRSTLPRSLCGGGNSGVACKPWRNEHSSLAESAGRVAQLGDRFLSPGFLSIPPPASIRD